MKRLLTLLMLLVVISGINAQNLVDENFDSYSVGTKFVQAVNSPYWLLDYGDPGSEYDVEVVNDYAVSPANAVRIKENSQLVLFLGDKDYGKHRVSFDAFVFNGSEAFIGLCNTYQTFNLPWALLFSSDNKVLITDYVGGGSIDIGTFEHNSWFNFAVVIDVDKDSVSYFKDDVLLYSGQWTNSCSAGIGAFCFIGVHPGIKWNMDNVVYYQYPTQSSPINLTAVPNENYVTLNWEPASGTTPDYYVLKRDGIVINDNITSTTFVDNGLFPRTYTYTVSAHLPGTGLTPPSDPAQATIEGGVDRSYVLFEIGTGTWCQYCPGAALGLDDLIANGKKVAGIEYHNEGNDIFQIPAGKIRVEDYYSISSYPTTIVDGIYSYIGGSHTTSIYDKYLPLYDTAMSVKTVAGVIVSQIEKIGDNTYSATIVATKQWPFFDNTVQLRTALVESDISYNWQGQTELNYVCRGMYPDATGVSLDFSSGDEFTKEIEFTIPDGVVEDNCEFICFLQNDNTKDVLNADKFDMAHVGISSIGKGGDFYAYPNPVTDVLSFDSKLNGTVRIYSLSGVEMEKFDLVAGTKTISTSNWPSGLYILQFETKTTQQTFKIVKK